MNAVEIEQAISELTLRPYNAAEFPFTFLAAFGNKDIMLKRLRTGNNDASDVVDGVVVAVIKEVIGVRPPLAWTDKERISAIESTP